MLEKLKGYLYISISQRRAIVITSILLSVYSLLKLAITLYYSPPLPEINFVQSNFITPSKQLNANTETDLNTIDAKGLIRLGIRQKTALTLIKYRKYCNGFSSMDQINKVFGITQKEIKILKDNLQVNKPGQTALDSNSKSNNIESQQNESQSEFHFEDFDPNKVNANELKNMGLPEKIVNGIINFHKSGFIYHQKSDLKKVYAMTPGWYEKLEPFINLPSDANESNQSLAPTKFKEVKLIDLNLASQEELQSLPGIGPYYAMKIIKYRNGLGGFASKEQLLSWNLLPDSVYQKIQSRISLNNSPTRIKVNSISLNELRQKWVIGNKAYLIINYRTSKGSIESYDELCSIAGLDINKLNKIKPYLDFTK